METINQAVITFSANGNTLTAKVSGGVEFEFNPDATREASTFGVNLLMTIPHYGTVFLDTLADFRTNSPYAGIVTLADSQLTLSYSRRF